MAEIEQALFTRLSGFSGLAALISARIYPMRAPQAATLPFVVYQRLPGGERVTAMGADPGVSFSPFQFDCYGQTYPSAKAVGTQLRYALERWRDANSNPEVLDSFIERDQDLDPMEEPVTELFRVSQDYRIAHREATS